MQAISGDNGQHLSCVKGGYGLCYMQLRFETDADHFLTLAAKGESRKQEYLGCQKYTFYCHSLV
jgi:hypothetical protein